MSRSSHRRCRLHLSTETTAKQAVQYAALTQASSRASHSDILRLFVALTFDRGMHELSATPESPPDELPSTCVAWLRMCASSGTAPASFCSMFNGTIARQRLHRLSHCGQAVFCSSCSLAGPDCVRQSIRLASRKAGQKRARRTLGPQPCRQDAEAARGASWPPDAKDSPPAALLPLCESSRSLGPAQAPAA